MNFTDIDEIREDGFQGFLRIAHMLMTGCTEVPDHPGIYFVLWPHATRPRFLQQSNGGRHKGREPSVSVAVLESRWVEGVPVIYIGKAGSATGNATLKRRLQKYMRFGQGQPAAHWGGRYIWQLADVERAMVCWRTTTGHMAPQLESQLIQAFAARYGKRPFANLRD